MTFIKTASRYLFALAGLAVLAASVLVPTVKVKTQTISLEGSVAHADVPGCESCSSCFSCSSSCGDGGDGCGDSDGGCGGSPGDDGCGDGDGDGDGDGGDGDAA